MTIAVVGSDGFIGSSLLTHAGPDEHEWNDARRIGRDVDLRDFDNCMRALDGIDTVYMLAGVTGGTALLADRPTAMVTPNVVINANMFEAAHRQNVKRMICMSSTTGYPDKDNIFFEDEYFDGEPPACYFNVGHTRRYIERLGAMYPKMSVIFLRCTGAYGPGDDYNPETSHVIGATIRKVAERQDPIVVWGNGNNEREGTYISDLCRALYLAKELNGHHAINIGSGEAMSVNAMLGILLMHAEYEPKVIYDDSKPVMVKSRRLDITKAKKMLDWEPLIGMTRGLCLTLDKYARK